MIITASSLVNETLTVVIDNGQQILTAKSDHPKWQEIRDAYKAGNNDLLQSLISLKSVVEAYSVGALSINTTGVTYNGRPLHTVDTQRVMAFLRENLPYKPIANYIEKKQKNPSKRAIEEMFNFLEHKAMPLTPEGNFIAYKGVRNDYWSGTGNLETIVLQGQVDKEGHILNTIGSIIEVERSSVDDNFKNHCSSGLHAGSISYAKDFAGTGRVILVEINPMDVVSIPDDCGCQKLRCSKYKVIGEYTGKLNDTYTDEFEKKSDDNTSKFANDSHTKLKRDEYGRFLPKDAYNCNGCSYPEEDCVCHVSTGKCETCPKCLRTYDTCICVNEPECTGECSSCECDKPETSPVVQPTPIEHSIATTEIPKVESPGCNIWVTDTSNSTKKLLFIQSIYNKLVHMYEETVCSHIPITFNTNMGDGMDSLDVIEMIMVVEREYLIDLDDDHIYDNVRSMTFAEAVDYVIRAIFAQKIKITFESYMQGFTDALNDFECKTPAKYLVNDWSGADTEEHRQYMIGYVYGYKAEALPVSNLKGKYNGKYSPNAGDFN